MNTPSTLFSNLGPRALFATTPSLGGANMLSRTMDMRSFLLAQQRSVQAPAPPQQPNVFFLAPAAWLEIHLYMANMKLIAQSLEYPEIQMQGHRLASCWELTFQGSRDLASRVSTLGTQSSQMFRDLAAQLAANAAVDHFSEIVGAHAREVRYLDMLSDQLSTNLKNTPSSCQRVQSLFDTMYQDALNNNDLFDDDEALMRQLTAAQARLSQCIQRFNTIITAAGMRARYTLVPAVGWIPGSVDDGPQAALARQAGAQAAQAANEITAIQANLSPSLWPYKLNASAENMPAKLSEITSSFQFMQGVWSAMASDLDRLAIRLKDLAPDDLLADLDLEVVAGDWERIGANAGTFLISMAETDTIFSTTSR